mmetsp:Transcript_3301/g.6176  ORF Transcript_3301/g.6176 Transcript_3301/m.6176 type:complete len:235 (+) Transcript_3301:62-766(+)
MSEASKTVSLGDFPMHILVQILSMCPADAAVRVCCTCAQLHLLSTDTELWGLQAAQLQRLHSRLAPIAAAASARRNRLCADWGIESDAVADAADACAAAQTLWKHDGLWNSDKVGELVILLRHRPPAQLLSAAAQLCSDGQFDSCDQACAVLLGALPTGATREGFLMCGHLKSYEEAVALSNTSMYERDRRYVYVVGMLQQIREGRVRSEQAINAILGIMQKNLPLSFTYSVIK